MSVVTIKAKSRHRRDLVEVASRRANGLLDSCRDRVLVVYDQQGASIYYEREDHPPKSHKSS